MAAVQDDLFRLQKDQDDINRQIKNAHLPPGSRDFAGLKQGCPHRLREVTSDPGEIVRGEKGKFHGAGESRVTS
jgi:hypothetical protein